LLRNAKIYAGLRANSAVTIFEKYPASVIFTLVSFPKNPNSFGSKLSLEKNWSMIYGFSAVKISDAMNGNLLQRYGPSST
jgi:hypothetical protein